MTRRFATGRVRAKAAAVKAAAAAGRTLMPMPGSSFVDESLRSYVAGRVASTRLSCPSASPRRRAAPLLPRGMTMSALEGVALAEPDAGVHVEAEGFGGKGSPWRSASRACTGVPSGGVACNVLASAVQLGALRLALHLR